MAILPISILMALTFWTSSAFPDSTDPAPVFSDALQSYKAGDFVKSRQIFSDLLTQHPNDPVLLYNLGLVEMDDKHPGKALAYWRKALYLQPGFSPALSGISQVHKLIPNANPTLAEIIYWRIPLWFFMSACFLFFIASGILWILHASRRKKEISSPLLLPMLASSLALLFAGFSIHAFITYYSTTQGTVLESALAVRSSPSADAPSLLEFNEGDEVEVIRTQDDWLQVQKSATALGWVTKDKVLIHSGF